MFDIHFYMQAHVIQKRIDAGEKFSKNELFAEFEKFRSKIPIVYNIETTNACNMRCEMCPRTTMMTRPVKTLKNPVPEVRIKAVKKRWVRHWFVADVT